MTVQSTVTSKEIGTPATTSARSTTEHWTLGIVLLMFGLPAWLAGARYTVDGWIWGLNWFLAWLKVPLVIPSLIWWLYLAFILSVGWLYSRVEVKQLPIRRTNGKLIIAAASVWAGFLLAASTDLGSTMLGVTNPGADAWPLARWVARTTWAAIVWTALLTFLPEWLIVMGLRKIKR